MFPQSSSKPIKRVLLWTAPRCLSTAFEISISTLPDVKVLDEPFVVPYFTENPFKTEKPAIPMSYSYEEACKMLVANYPGQAAVFAKDFPFHIQGRFEMFLDSSLGETTHSFLIRNPQRAILSYYKTSQEIFMEAYATNKIGFTQLHDFYFFLKRSLNINPVVIDADDLLANPEAMMELYCKNVGLTYKSGMSKWESGVGWGQEQTFFDIKMWREDAIKSTGFRAPTPLPALPDDLPPEVTNCIKESFQTYHAMYKFRTTTK